MLSVLSESVHVAVAAAGDGRIDLYAVQRAGEPAPALVGEAYDAGGLVAGGQIEIWELNQAIAALLASRAQARRLALRADAAAHGGHLDLLRAGERVDVVATSGDGSRRIAFETTPMLLVADLNTLLRHYLDLTRAATPRTIVLDPGQASARPALTRPLP